MARRGMGNVRRRKDGRWEASLTIGYTTRGNPKRVSRCTTKGNHTQREAEKLLNELIQGHNHGISTDINKVTVNQWLETWLQSKTGIEEATQKKYYDELRPIRETLGYYKLQKLKPATIRQAYNDIANNGFSQRAQKKARTHLNAALKLAVVEEVIFRNPSEAVQVEKPRVSSERKAQAWTPSEVQSFIKVAENHRLHNLFYMMLTLGLRCGEALGLMWEDIDVIESTIQIKRSYSSNGSKMVMKSVKTSSSRRTLYLSNDLLLMLKVMQKENNDGLLFQSLNNTPINPSNLRRTFKKITANASVKEIRLHDLRHTYATLALQRGVQLEYVSQRLGHAKPSTTIDIYRHLYEPERKEAALSLTDLLGNQSRMVN